jgi:hypothetical protein
MSNPANTRVVAYHWYLGSAFWRASHTCEKCGKRRATDITSLISASSRSYRARSSRAV